MLITSLMSDEIEMDDSDPRKGRIPLVISTTKVPLRILRDSTSWRQKLSGSNVPSRSNTRSVDAMPKPPSSRLRQSAAPATSEEDDTDVDQNAAEDEHFSIGRQSYVQPNPQRRSTPREDSTPRQRQNSMPLPSGTRGVTSLLPAATVHVHKRQREWPQEEHEPSRRHRQRPPTNPLPSSHPPLQPPPPQRQPHPQQVPDRFRPIFEDERQLAPEPPRGINGHFRATRTSSRDPRIIMRSANSTAMRPPTSQGHMRAYPAQSSREPPPPYQPRFNHTAGPSAPRRQPTSSSSSVPSSSRQYVTHMQPTVRQPLAERSQRGDPHSRQLSTHYSNNRQPVGWVAESTTDEELVDQGNSNAFVYGYRNDAEGYSASEQDMEMYEDEEEYRGEQRNDGDSEYY